jgi:hypothetical protein
MPNTASQEGHAFWLSLELRRREKVGRHTSATCPPFVSGNLQICDMQSQIFYGLKTAQPQILYFSPYKYKPKMFFRKKKKF